MIIKTLGLATPMVTHLLNTCHPDDIENQYCFQVLGYDVLIDSSFKPLLLEINQCPSFATDSPLDIKIKRGLLSDVLNTLCLSRERRR